jgi:hypothetical protein
VNLTASAGLPDPTPTPGCLASGMNERFRVDPPISEVESATSFAEVELDWPGEEAAGAVRSRRRSIRTSGVDQSRVQHLS